MSYKLLFVLRPWRNDQVRTETDINRYVTRPEGLHDASLPVVQPTVANEVKYRCYFLICDDGFVYQSVKLSVRVRNLSFTRATNDSYACIRSF